MKKKILSGKKVFLRYPTIEDLKEFTELNRSSAQFHKGLVNPPKDEDAFTKFYAGNESDANESFLICELKTEGIAGAINL